MTGQTDKLIGDVVRLIGRPVPEISSFETSKMADFMTSLLTS